MAELIKTLRITPHATTKITPFEAHYGRKPNTPLTSICTTPKISNLSWENTKLSCLDEKILTKSALTPEAIWNRELNSEDELSVVYKQTYLPEPSCEPAGPSSQVVGSKTPGQTIPKRAIPEQKRQTQQKQTSLSDTDEDELFDQALLRKFPIGAHLPLNNIPYDLQKVKRSFLAENPNYDIANVRTRKPIRWLTQQEKQRIERAPLVFLKDRFKGPQNTIDPVLGKRIEQVARKSGTIARKTKNPGVFGSQFKVIENGSIINYSPHTAWVREDGKQPRVIRHDGLAFVPDPRVYGKCRPAQLKDFVAYKHLPRAKSLILGKDTKQCEPTGSKIPKKKSMEQGNPAGNTSTPTSPKRKPPKNVEELIRQTTNRRKLGHDRIHRTNPTTSKAPTRKIQTATTKNLKSPSRKGKGSPNKMRKEENKNIEFDCDTSISISSDDSIIQDLRQSPKMPPAKKLDRKTTPPHETNESTKSKSAVPSRRSTRTKTSALALKFGNAIPINQITGSNSDTEVCIITVQQDKREPTGQTITVQESSTDIECIEIDSRDKTPGQSCEKTPEQLRVTESGEGTGGPLEAEYEPTNTVKTPTTLSTHTSSPQSSPTTKFTSELNTSTTSIGLNNPQQRAISSRYVIGRPNETSCSPDKSFIDNFNDAMKILHSISPPKNSMTFQREYEVQERSKRPSKHAKEENNNKPSTTQTPQTSSERNAQQISQISLDGNDPKSSIQSHKDAAEDIKNI